MFFRMSIAALLLSSIQFTTAHPTTNVARGDDPRFMQWAPPGPSDVRGPCPGLNALANHGFIHRNGKNLDLLNVLHGSAAGMNIGADFTLAIFTAGLLSSPDPFGTTFDLDNLQLHNFPIEHDVSLSREDAALGSNKVFNSTIYNEFINTYNGQGFTSIPTAASAKITRFNTQKKRNPDFVYGLREFIFSYGETALYLQTMANDTTSGVAPVAYVRSLFEEERLPYHLGWRPNPQPITLLSLGAMIPPLFALTGETAPEGANIVADSFKDLFEPIGPLGTALQSAAKRLEGVVPALLAPLLPH